ncbi:NAD(P)H-binding protein [Paraburkholderia acidisoli]|uniref:NAD(P)H-binding protein n=1 Tax=Paraburkholderia acidisoli TaxID=2571748 RepID=A0A7Z2GRZ2_9BURK|nr:NAD(P)H-binding protein [Paraburkholderia acidisoli]QGZ66750.1 NAD(P)H-binding protein [Paraburkholderia acidisoli]
MKDAIWLAGAAGAIGTALVPLLIDAGYAVFGSTRKPERARALEAAGVTPVIVDVFDADALRAALVRVAPRAVIHQLTDLPFALDAAKMAQATAANARLRDEGTRHLVAAAVAAGSARLIAQSIAWAYRDTPAKPYDETQPLDVEAEGARGISVRGVASLERQTLHTPALAGTVLRYGQIWGPRTGFDAPVGASPVHVEAAAFAAFYALERGASGAFNIADDHADADNAKAKRELGWSPALRLARDEVRR